MTMLQRAFLAGMLLGLGLGMGITDWYYWSQLKKLKKTVRERLENLQKK